MKNFPFPKKTVNLTSRNALHRNTICFKNSYMDLLSRKGAGFIGLKGNSKQNLSFYKETYANSAILYRPVKDFSHNGLITVLLGRGVAFFLSFFSFIYCL